MYILRPLDCWLNKGHVLSNSGTAKGGAYFLGGLRLCFFSAGELIAFRRNGCLA